LWKPKASCRFLLTTSLGTANCRARWRVELHGRLLIVEQFFTLIRQQSIVWPAGRLFLCWLTQEAILKNTSGAHIPINIPFRCGDTDNLVRVVDKRYHLSQRRLIVTCPDLRSLRIGETISDNKREFACSSLANAQLEVDVNFCPRDANIRREPHS
jgi:hypothetical protein